ncbi:uncharacterized protein CCOS01_04424 [Colletotrichum costaricense]|uniref:NACHT domain-containing protein n=1 Tax=Colletotrichum costaricense TaxID=1209916 RepID=A0AAI9Z2V3_9PEZI|nr:uncharacterized protein CCOS01_04424 [Colletotrichum costaricense]KAK1532441.1 hypothetical protein CCOS01_04424 [Colletotrichum costaricense]
MGLSLKKKLKDLIRGPKKDDAPKEPLRAHPNPRQQASALAEKAPSSCTTGSSGTAQSISASEPSNTLQEDTRDEPTAKLMPSQNSEGSIRQLWDVAYQNLRNQEESLVQEFEDQICGNLAAGLGVGVRSHAGTKDWLATILKHKMDQVNRESWKLKFGSSEVEVQDVVKPVLAVVDWANDFVAKALVSNPYASIAWSGVSLLLPLLLNPLDQAAALAKGLEHISSLIVRSSMWEDLYVRRYESKTSEASPEPHAAYRLVLERLYREILKFQIVCYRYHNHKTASRMALDSVKHHDWEELLEQIKYHETEFDKVSNHVRDQAYTDEWEIAEARHQKAMNHWERIGTDVSDLRRRIEEIQNDEKRKELLNWLCTVDPSVQYNAARSKHRSGTCEWLIQDNEDFKTWETAPKSFLWLNGKAGSGKSILSSSVIKNLKEKSEENPQVALAYYFFSFGNLEQQKVTVMLSSLIGQFCARRPDTPQPIKELESFIIKRERPDTETLENALRAAVRGFSAAYIVVDALDECPILDGERTRLMDCLNVRLAHFTVKEYLISNRIEQSPAKQFWFTERNAHLHIAHCCLSYHVSQSAEAEESNDELLLKSYAIENWVRHLDLVPRHEWSSEVVRLAERALFTCSSSLNLLIRKMPLSYDTELADWFTRKEQIDMQQRPYCYTAGLGSLNLTKLLLRGASRASMYLVQEDLNLTLRVAAKAGYHDIVQFILALCAGDKARDAITVGPLQAAAYQGHLAIISLLLDSGADINAYDDEFGSALKAAAMGNQPTALQLLLSRGADVRKAGCLLSCWISTYEENYVNVPENTEVLQLLLDGGADINSKCARHGSPLNQAIKRWLSQKTRSYFDFVVGHGADITLDDGRDGTPLQAACLKKLNDDIVDPSRSIAVIEALLDMGADVNGQGGECGNALQVACREQDDHTGVISLLLDRGAEINQLGGRYGTALHAACSNADPELVNFLLDKGADPAVEGGEFGSVLQAACSNYELDYRLGIVKKLVEQGADINAVGGKFGSALQAAASHKGSFLYKGGHEDVETFLLSKGAEVNMQGGIYSTALQAACEGGKMGAIRLLLSHGADVNVEGGKYGTALQAACAPRPRGKDCYDMARLLIEHGANVHVQGGLFGSAWHAAAATAPFRFDETTETMRLLLDHGIDIDSIGRPHGTALQAALENFQDHDRLVLRLQLLLERGADVNLGGGQYGFPLQSACVVPSNYRYEVNICGLIYLLENCPEINVNMTGGIFGTALQAATSQGKTKGVELLLQKGADTNIRGGKYRSALNAAIFKGYWDLVEILLDAGAKPDFYHLSEPDEEWLESIGSEDGKGAVDRYRKFWEIETLKLSQGKAVKGEND